MAAHDVKKVLKRLKNDLHELTSAPLPNISAVPLESNMLEWHCNILHNDNILHLILFFTKDYPLTPPSLEVMPQGFNMYGIVVRKGDKGTQVCLDIFSDFLDHHPEWNLRRDSGWSPSYTVQSLLLNFMSYLTDNQQEEDQSLISFLEMSKTFKCDDCGHTDEAPFPPLDTNICLHNHDEEDSFESSTSNKDSPTDDDISTILNTDAKHIIESDNTGSTTRDIPIEHLDAKIMDYVSRDKFLDNDKSSINQIFGFGLSLGEYETQCRLSSPCEFLTANSFYEMYKALGRGRSILREDLIYFLPLFISNNHAANIRLQFENTMAKISKRFRFKYSLRNNNIHVIINVFCNLLTSLVNKCYTSGKTPSDVLLDGFFQIHRLFIWVVNSYPKVLKYINKRLTKFIANPKLQKNKFGFDYDYCFALLSVSNYYSWEDVVDIYLREHWRRSVKSCLLLDPVFCSMDLSMEERLAKTFHLTTSACGLLAYHVNFLKTAVPIELTQDRICQRYEENLSFLSHANLSKLRDTLISIKDNVKSFDDWFKIICLPVPSKEHLFNELTESVLYAVSTKLYH